MTSFALFDTAIGACGMAWTDAGICRVLLPDATQDRVRAQLVQRFGAAAEQPPPPAVASVMEGIAHLMAGAPVPLTDAALDETGVPEFHRRVYALTRQIEPGATASYGQLAAQLGKPGAAQAVGRALGENPFPIVVPCHRVLAADGSMHGFSAPGGIATKRRMLQIEGALAPDEPTLF